MSKQVQEKVKKALEAGQEVPRRQKCQEFKCPLRAWDIISMLKEDYKSRKKSKDIC